jgi:hypothetical protein
MGRPRPVLAFFLAFFMLVPTCLAVHFYFQLRAWENKPFEPRPAVLWPECHTIEAWLKDRSPLPVRVVEWYSRSEIREDDTRIIGLRFEIMGDKPEARDATFIVRGDQVVEFQDLSRLRRP